jgi:hypothetical protein
MFDLLFDSGLVMAALNIHQIKPPSAQPWLP